METQLGLVLELRWRFQSDLVRVRGSELVKAF